MLKDRIKAEYLGIQEGAGKIPSMILVNAPCEDQEGLTTVIYNPYKMQLSFPDKLKMLKELGFLNV